MFTRKKDSNNEEELTLEEFNIDDMILDDENSSNPEPEIDLVQIDPSSITTENFDEIVELEDKETQPLPNDFPPNILKALEKMEENSNRMIEKFDSLQNRTSALEEFILDLDSKREKTKSDPLSDQKKLSQKMKLIKRKVHKPTEQVSTEPVDQLVESLLTRFFKADLIGDVSIDNATNEFLVVFLRQLQSERAFIEAIKNE